MQQSIWLSEVIHKESSRLLLYNLTAGDCFDRSLQRVNDRRFAWQTTHQIVAGTKPKNSYGAPKSECVCIWQLIFWRGGRIFWRGGRIFEPTKHDLNPRKHDFKKKISKKERHKIAFLKKKKKESGLKLIFPPRFWGVDFPPQFGECQYLSRHI